MKPEGTTPQANHPYWVGGYEGPIILFSSPLMMMKTIHNYYT
jgi:hypothetical protein